MVSGSSSFTNAAAFRQAASVAEIFFSKDLQAIRSNLYGSNGNFTGNINGMMNWLNAQEVVENDLIEGVDGRKHKILTQISRLDEFSQELSALRPLMALNQGIPNKLID